MSYDENQGLDVFCASSGIPLAFMEYKPESALSEQSSVVRVRTVLDCQADATRIFSPRVINTSDTNYSANILLEPVAVKAFATS